MLQSINISKNKTLLDIVCVLTIISIFTSLLSMFGITIPYLGFFGVPLFLAIILFIGLIGFEWRMKKWGWIFLNLLVVVGIILQFAGGALAYQEFTSGLSEEDFLRYVRSEEGASGRAGLPPEASIGYKSIFYAGQILFLIGLLSFVLFYFMVYRKYITGQLSAEQIGGEKFKNKQEIQERWQQSEKKQNVVNKIMMWIIFLLIIFIVGFLIAKSIFSF